MHGFVHEMRRDRLRRGDVAAQTRIRAACPPRSLRQPETDRNAGDGRRSAHNPEVAGSNPAPATNQFRRSEASSGSGRGLLAKPCAREIVHKPFSIRLGWLFTETSRHDLRLCGTRGTILLALLGAWPTGCRRIRTPRRPTLVASAERPGLACTRGTPRPHRGKVVRSPDLPRCIFVRTRRSSAPETWAGGCAHSPVLRGNARLVAALLWRARMGDLFGRFAPGSCRHKRSCVIRSPSASRWPPGISTTKSRRPHGWSARPVTIRAPRAAHCSCRSSTPVTPM